jgi:hypothetical protein
MQTTIKDKGHVMKNMVDIEHGFDLTFEHWHKFIDFLFGIFCLGIFSIWFGFTIMLFNIHSSIVINYYKSMRWEFCLYN